MDMGVQILDWEVEGLRIAVKTVTSHGEKSDSGLCKSGRGAVACEECSQDVDLASGKDGFCPKEEFDKEFELGVRDAKAILASPHALLTIHVAFVAKIPLELLKFIYMAIENSVPDVVLHPYLAQGDVVMTCDKVFFSGNFYALKTIIDYCAPHTRWTGSLIEALREERYGWLICGGKGVKG